MTRKYQIAVKFGGALTEEGPQEQIEALGKAITDEYLKKANFLVIPGGGIFAEIIRKAQKRYKLQNEEVHWMAILAMDQHAYLLQRFIPHSRVISVEKIIQEQKPSSQVPILSVYSFLKRKSLLEHSWKVTSDALAVEIARHLKVERIIFLKAIDGVIINNTLIKTLSLEAFIQLKSTILDPKTPEVLENSQMDIRIINGYHPERLEKALYEKNFIGTEILCKKSHKT